MSEVFSSDVLPYSYMGIFIRSKQTVHFDMDEFSLGLSTTVMYCHIVICTFMKS